ncbi:MFS transporter [Variovorax sp. Sphag1AA]|uniref:MFS transporter n=1 Tax=Variovorax sp. Sphag1AA TaxID=2587027 RepID=UPI001622E91D|nr:MFS transporter [Variovorax sp. Sphag1AA]MBB3178780.1 putative MFS family arabinose efflux permease [Variovorax sp. Sphag1AA]
MSHTLWTSAAPALAYRLYEEQWHLSTIATMAIFAVYPIAVVSTLLLFGNLSDIVGRRAAMLLGVSFSLGGITLFAAATNLAALFVGRALMGVGVGLSAGPSTAALVDFSPPGRADVASLTATAAQSIGMAAALLLSGALIEYAPYPTRLSFVVLAVLLVGLLAAVRRVPRPRVPIAWSHWRPSLPVVPPAGRRPFLIATASLTTAYTNGALLLSLGGHIAHDLIGSPNALVNAALLTLFPIALGLAGVLARGTEPQTLLNRGALGSLVGMTLLAVAIALRSVPIMFAAAAASGAGYSFQVSGGLVTLATASSSKHRGGIVSAALLVAYLAMGSAALLLGLAAAHWGLGAAVDLGAVTIASLSAIAWAIANFKDRSEAGCRAGRLSDRLRQPRCSVCHTNG